jgi:2-dehydro-3-deoxygluconokinase
VSRAGAPRVVTFGELLLRLSPPGDERLLESPHLLTFFGGAEANVAVALSHLGVRCDYVTRLPANPIGDAGLAALQAEGVGTRWIVRGGERLGIYFVEPSSDLRAMRVVYDRAGSAFARIDPHAVDWAAVLSDADWLHTSGITPALGDAPAATLAAAVARARDQNVPVSLDLNYREALWRDRDPRPLVEPLARQATVLIANPAAVRAMLGIEADDASLATPARARELAERLVERCGAKRVALTRREILGAREHGWSAVLYDAETRSFAASRRHCVQVVDRVGGGDSFAAALIARLLGGDPLADALEFAVAASALKLTVAGDFSRASVEEVEELLRT